MDLLTMTKGLNPIFFSNLNREIFYILSHSLDICLFHASKAKKTGIWDVNTTIALSALEICKKLYFVKVSQN